MSRRILDIALSSLLILTASPLIILVGLSIYLLDGSPVLFRQVRVGLNGRHFTLVKFRTMKSSLSEITVTTADDLRITPIGRLLRRTKLDEIPQFFNVLAGAMSLVGPRPDVPSESALLEPEIRQRILSVKPGITDDASIHFRHEQELLTSHDSSMDYFRDVVVPQKMALSLQAIENATLSSYFKTLWRTFRVIIQSRGNCPCAGCRS